MDSMDCDPFMTVPSFSNPRLPGLHPQQADGSAWGRRWKASGILRFGGREETFHPFNAEWWDLSRLKKQRAMWVITNHLLQNSEEHLFVTPEVYS